MPFRFRMQKVLEYREQLEEEARAGLAQARQRHEQALVERDRLKDELGAAERQARESPLMSPGELWISQQYRKGLASDLNAAEMQERMTAQLQDEARKLLAVRAIDKKLLEKLRERQKQHWQRAEMLKEQHFNDEIATVRNKVQHF